MAYLPIIAKVGRQCDIYMFVVLCRTSGIRCGLLLLQDAYGCRMNTRTYTYLQLKMGIVKFTHLAKDSDHYSVYSGSLDMGNDGSQYYLTG